MKKIIPILFVFFLIYGFINKEEIVIPSYAIRFRVIANSNTIEDQNLKMQIKNDIEQKLTSKMTKVTTSNEAREELLKSIPEIKTIIQNYTTDFQVNYGQNYFPEKNYHGLTYPAGNYESLVITIGKGNGNNWWCVMFPPLCLLEAKDNQTEQVEYKFLIKEILNKYHS